MEWIDAVNAIELKIDTYFESRGWEKNEYQELVGVLDFTEEGDREPARYIGGRPLSIIMSPEGDRVYGQGAEGVARFIEESWVSTFEEELVERLSGTDYELSEEEEEWLGDDDVWEEISSYIQGFVRPVVDVDAVGKWIAQQNF